VQRNGLAETLETLKLLERLELALASFYGLCGEPAANGPEFWATLAREERQHAETLRRMSVILAQRPERFEPNRAVHVAPIQAVVSATMAHTAKIAARLAVTPKRV